jgi:hypothetical protein
MTPQASLAAALVAIYAVLSLPVLYIAFRHGLRGGALVGWGYLFIFCTLKMVGNGIQLGNPESSGAAIVSSVGLSPLLLAAAGILHEGYMSTWRSSPSTTISSLSLPLPFS